MTSSDGRQRLLFAEVDSSYIYSRPGHDRLKGLHWIMAHPSAVGAPRAGLFTWWKLICPVFSFSSTSWSHTLQSMLGWFYWGHFPRRHSLTKPSTLWSSDTVCSGAWSFFRAMKQVSTSRKQSYDHLCHCGHLPLQSLPPIQRLLNSGITTELYFNTFSLAGKF